MIDGNKSDRSRFGVEDFFQRSLTAHLPQEKFRKLQGATVLMGGCGGGSNIAELLARKGIGRFILCDLDVYEPHNIRQRCSLTSTLGVEKVSATATRLKDVQPHVEVEEVREGVTADNAGALVSRSDVIVDMIDLHALHAKVAIHQVSRKQGKYVLTAPSVVNGAMLWVFAPDGPTFEEFTGYEPGAEMSEIASRHLKRMIDRYPEEAPEAMYEAAARGERTIPLDGVGVDQAAVMVAAAVENIVLERFDRVITVPRGLHVDVSDPEHLADIVDRSREFEVRHADHCS